MTLFFLIGNAFFFLLNLAMFFGTGDWTSFFVAALNALGAYGCYAKLIAEQQQKAKNNEKQ